MQESGKILHLIGVDIRNQIDIHRGAGDAAHGTRDGSAHGIWNLHFVENFEQLGESFGWLQDSAPGSHP